MLKSLGTVIVLDQIIYSRLTCMLLHRQLYSCRSYCRFFIFLIFVSNTVVEVAVLLLTLGDVPQLSTFSVTRKVPTFWYNLNKSLFHKFMKIKHFISFHITKMQPMQSIIKILWIIIITQVKHILSEHTKTANNKYSFEYLCLPFVTQ